MMWTPQVIKARFKSSKSKKGRVGTEPQEHSEQDLDGHQDALALSSHLRLPPREEDLLSSKVKDPRKGPDWSTQVKCIV